MCTEARFEMRGVTCGQVRQYAVYAQGQIPSNVRRQHRRRSGHRPPNSTPPTRGLARKGPLPFATNDAVNDRDHTTLWNWTHHSLAVGKDCHAQQIGRQAPARIVARPVSVDRCDFRQSQHCAPPDPLAILDRTRGRQRDRCFARQNMVRQAVDPTACARSSLLRTLPAACWSPPSAVLPQRKCGR